METASIDFFEKYFPNAPIHKIGEDFFVADVYVSKNSQFTLPYPLKFDGIITMFCSKGNLVLTIDLVDYLAEPDTFFVSVPGDIIKLRKDDNYKGNLHLHVMAISNRLLDVMNLNRQYASLLFKYRMVKATGKYKNLILGYRAILQSLTEFDHPHLEESLCCILRSLYTESMFAWKELSPAIMPTTRNRDKSTIYDTFIQAVNAHHNAHHDLSFYADMMNITAKHLSTTIKAFCGKTAAEILDSYILMEAKNLIKYTSKSVKQISEELGFASQLSFYRFFLRHEGVSPTDYRKSE